MPWLILSMFSLECSESPSRKAHFIAAASIVPIVVLPDPATLITTMIMDDPAVLISLRHAFVDRGITKRRPMGSLVVLKVHQRRPSNPAAGIIRRTPENRLLPIAPLPASRT